MAYGLFRFIAAVGRSMIVASTFGSFALMILFVLGGFVISKDDIHKWWIWAYWLSPMTYGQNALAVNEFLAHRWNLPYNINGNDTTTIGKAVLKERGIPTEAYWYWIGVGALAGFVLLFNVLYTLALAYLNPLSRPQAIIPEDNFEEKQFGEHSSHPKSNVQTFSIQGSTAGNKSQRRRSMSAARSNRVDIDLEADDSNTEMALPFQPLAITFNNMNYYVDMPAEMKQLGLAEEKLQLLRGVSGVFRPGILTALVGVSGAGKTTLMDVLAGRKTKGYIEGEITISGYPKKQETFARIAGYCEQTDIHSPHVTVRESLIYSAWLRLPKEVDKTTRLMFVDEVMQLIELDTIEDAIVGLPGVTGLSTEQRKRLTIAVELVANPSIIFMDEPTSGLDARAAAIVMRTVRNTVDTGRTVVCTIHQPSVDIFEAFDELLLMKRGGRVIYAGSLGHHSRNLVEYFEAIPGVPKIKEGYNPATWMLEISSVEAEAHLGVDFAEIYKNSFLFQRNQALINEMSVPIQGSKELSFPTQYSQSFAMQCMACLWKQHWSYWRNPNYNAVRLFSTTVIALVFGTVFWKLGPKTNTQQDITNVMGAMYAATLFLGVSNANSAQPVVDIERTVFYRERAAGLYSPLSYAFGQLVVEIPYIFAQTIIYGLIVFSMMGFHWNVAKLFWFLFFMFCAFLFYTYYGMTTIAATPNTSFSSIIGQAFNVTWNLFSGFMIARPRIPVWWRWYYWGDPLAWTLNGLITSQLGDLNNVKINVPGSGNETVTEYLGEYFGFHHSFLGAVAGVQVGIIILMAIVFALCIKFLNFQKR